MSHLFQTPSYLFFEEALLKKRQFKEFLGSFDQKSADAKQMLIATGREEDLETTQIILHLLVDQTDGVIADVKFQIFGRCEDYLVMGALAEFILLKSYPQAAKVSSQILESKLKKDLKMALPESFSQALNRALFVLDEALSACKDIPVNEKELITPLDSETGSNEIENWISLPINHQLEILEKVIAEDIRPYIELDEGGIEIVSLKESIFLTIGYKGACTTCHSSTGSTLQAIQNILRNKVFPSLVVIPDASWLQTARG